MGIGGRGDQRKERAGHFVPLEHRYILGVRVDATSYRDATDRALAWARADESRYVCVANAHVVMEAHDSPAFRRIVSGADLVTPDGMSIVWTMRRFGIRGQGRVYGPDLMLAVSEAAQAQRVPVGFYGGRAEGLERLVAVTLQRFPKLQVAYAYAPPFRPPTAEEDERVVAALNASGARILFVGLGCPKQERWMAEHMGRVQAVMLGVGAAFALHAGLVKPAPRWMQRAGLEWFHRLLMEPRRLWWRYAKHNPRFVVLVGMQILGLYRFGEVEG